MPTVLLTGANGFLATHILKYLVESSYDVVGTVRTQAKADDVVAAHPEFKDRVRLVAVPNMSASGAYDEVLKNNKIEYIIHAAAPVPDGGGIDFDRDFLTPAVQGNLELLQAAKKYGSSLKRFVFTSSMVAVYDIMSPYDGHLLKSTDWNPVSADVARQIQHPGVSYAISKTLAEKSIWDFVEKEKATFKVTTLCMPLIVGPPLQTIHKDAAGKHRFNLSSDHFYGVFLAPPQSDGTWAYSGPLYTGYIDVRDLAVIHVKSLTQSPAGENTRLLLSNPEPLLAQTGLKILADRFPQLKGRLGAVRAADVVAKKEQEGEKPLKVDDSEAKALFGSKIYRSLEDTVVDITKRLLELELEA